jgi:hypothetical protein
MKTVPVDITAKPIRMQAMQWTGDNEEAIREFVKPDDVMKVKDGGIIRVWNREDKEWYEAPVFYYIIRGTKNEYSTCSAESFERHYEVIAEEVLPEVKKPE